MVIDRRRVATVGVVVMAVVLAGCAGDDGNGAATDEPTGTATPIATPGTTEEPTPEPTGTATETATETPTSEPTGEPVEVFFSVGDGSDCSEVQGFPRVPPNSVPGDEDSRVAFAFGELLAGPTPEEIEAGAGSFFSSETADAVLSVVVESDRLTLDLADVRLLLNNASTSCGSEALLAQLNATAFGRGDVQETLFRIDGSCATFANWLQRDCFVTARDGTQREVPTIGQASWSGCQPASTDSLDDGRWYGLVSDVGPDQLAFDLACWFVGTAAADAAAEDGEESPPPNDYYVRNDSDLLRTLTVAPGTTVRWLPEVGDPSSEETVDYATWATAQPGRDPVPGVWLDVEDGQVVDIQEQYVP